VLGSARPSQPLEAQSYPTGHLTHSSLAQTIPPNPGSIASGSTACVWGVLLLKTCMRLSKHTNTLIGVCSSYSQRSKRAARAAIGSTTGINAPPTHHQARLLCTKSTLAEHQSSNTESHHSSTPSRNVPHPTKKWLRCISRVSGPSPLQEAPVSLQASQGQRTKLLQSIIQEHPHAITCQPTDQPEARKWLQATIQQRPQATIQQLLQKMSW
jgi:hypothetical protein